MASSSAKPAAAPTKARVAVGSTGKDAEAFTELAITRVKPKPKVVMRLAPGGKPHASLPDLRPGDRLLVSAELELTADHEIERDDSVGVPYQFEPNVEVSLLLAAGPSAVTPGPKAILLKSDGRRVGHHRHHDVVVFDNIAFDLPPGGLPWAGSALINCTIASWHPDARSGQKLIVGQHNPPDPKAPNAGGTTAGNMSSISVARLRPGTGTVPVAVRETKPQVPSIPVVIDKPQKKIVYSHRLANLKKGEQIRVRAGLRTNCKKFGYSTRTTVEVFLSETAAGIDPGKEAQRVCPDSPQISRGNGKNTLPEDSAMESAKVGVIRIIEDASKPLFVNVLVTTGDPLKKASGGGHRLEILEGGFLAVTRYPAEDAG